MSDRDFKIIDKSENGSDSQAEREPRCWVFVS